MKKTFIILIGACLLAVFYGCNKDGVCVKSTGKIVRESRSAPPFHYIEVNDNINLFLTQDTLSNSITVEAGENLVAGITAEIDSGRLVLRNNNSCNWLRSFDVPVNVYISFRQLDTIIFQAAGNISNTNAWITDSVYVNVIEGAGNINLNLRVAKTTFQVRYGTVSVNLSGKSGVTFLSSSGYGPLHAEGLISKFTYVYTFSPNDVYVYASEEAGVEIANIGNVYCTGNPANVSTNIYGGGHFIEF